MTLLVHCKRAREPAAGDHVARGLGRRLRTAFAYAGPESAPRHRARWRRMSPCALRGFNTLGTSSSSASPCGG
jgi:hypothetical protein